MRVLAELFQLVARGARGEQFEGLTDAGVDRVGAVAGVQGQAGVQGDDVARGPRPVVEEFGQRLLDATQRGIDTPKAQRIVLVDIEESATERFSLDALWTAVQSFCLAQGIDPSLVGTRQDIVEYWRAKHDNGPAPRRQRMSGGWRARVVGAFIDDFIKGDATLNLRWCDGRLSR